MSSYIESTLGRDEQIIYRPQISWWSQSGLFIVGLLTVLIYGLGIIFFIMAVLNVLTTELGFTNKRIIAKFGFIRRQTVELRLEKVESLVVDQGVIGRILNYGSIVVCGTGASAAPVPYIKNPLAFRQRFNEYLDDLDAKKKD